MRDFLFLKFLDRFKGLFNKLGVNYEIMRKILQVKLLLDSRRSFTTINSSKDNEEKDSNMFLKSLWIYLFMGIFVALIMIPKGYYMFQMSIAFGIIMFMIMTSLISDFSSVLLDVKDKNVLFTRPVNSRTISFAKFFHIFIYMFYITMSIAGPSLVLGLFRQGFYFFILFFIEIIFMDMFIVVITALLYLLILKFFDGEKLKDIINYIQIILSITMSIGYQFVGRVIDFSGFTMVFTPKWWKYLIPPAWFAAPFEVFINKNTDIHYLIFTILAVIIPLIAMTTYVKLIPTFERNLQKLNNADRGVYQKSLSKKLGRIFCKNPMEKSFFNFTWNMLKNEREFKLKVYPSLGMSMVFPYLFIFTEFRKYKSFSQWLSAMSGSNYFLNIYFCALILPSIIMMVSYSGSYKGAWIYKVLPIKGLDLIFKGAIKASILKLMIPQYLVQCLIFMLIFGIRLIPQLILVFLNIIFFTIIVFISTKKALPFSLNFQVTQQRDGFKMIPLMLLLGLIVGVHYLSMKVSYGVFLYILAITMLNIVLWNKAFKISWKDIKV